jgi:hypothetical protein
MGPLRETGPRKFAGESQTVIKPAASGDMVESLQGVLLPVFRPLLAVLLALPVLTQAAVRVKPVPVPPEMRSSAYTVKVNGKPVDVAHAAASYEFASFDITGRVNVEITAAEAGFWDKGVDIQPWRLGLRPQRQGQTIRFRLAGPAKLSISRPGDFLNHAKMLFLFAGAPPPAVPKGPNVHVFQAGVHRGSLNPQSGDTYYLAPGAYFFGSLNLWKVQNVKVMGRGTIVYNGAQDPNNDQGWMQKPDWHCVGALESSNVEIDGLTCVVRSRTWSIQMKDSNGFVFDDLRLIGGNAANANQDGMDWLGGGNSIVRNSFLRASDDVFAMQGGWDGYDDASMVRPGHDVQNILIEHSVLSTSISNIVRAGWPRKNYNSRNFTLRDSDILHGGIGACGQSFGLIGFWGAQGAKGDHANFTFENLFLDNWYSLLQLEQKSAGLHGFTFHNIWALDQPPLAESTLSGSVSGVTFDNVKLGQKRANGDADLPLVVSNGAEQPHFADAHGPVAAFSVNPLVFAPGQPVTFTAQPVRGARYIWLFGDGSTARGRLVRHRFPDAEGTALDNSGRFRVLLHVTDRKGREDWASQGLVTVAHWHEAARVAGATTSGLIWQVYPGVWTELPNLGAQHALFAGEGPSLRANARGFTRYAAAWDGFLNVPADGGYTFHLMAHDGARLVIDGVEVARTGPPFAQVCGAPGNAMRYDRGSLGLRAGKHTFHFEDLHAVSPGFSRLLWEGPALPLTDVPPAAFSHFKQDAIKAGK